MGKSSISTLVSVQLANEITEMLERRAKARGLSRSRYAAMILEKWRDDKYPAIDAVDSTARAIVAQQNPMADLAKIEAEATRETRRELRDFAAKAGAGQIAKTPARRKAA